MAEDKERPAANRSKMKESILNSYVADLRRESLTRPASYHPVSLPQLPRAHCPCYTLDWNKDSYQIKQPCRNRAVDNGFCENHRLSYEFLEIGAQLGYPEVKVPFIWREETLYRTIWSGVEGWEAAAVDTRRLLYAMDFIKKEYADQLAEPATI